MDITILLPGYNEADNLEPLFRQIRTVLDNLKLKAEVLFVNDGSTDDTKEVLETIKEWVSELRVIHHPVRVGLTATIETGILAAKGDIIVYLCSDMQSHPKEDIPKLLSALDDDCDVVLGYRVNRFDCKIVVSWIYNTLVRLLFGLKVHDLNWIKAFRKKCLDNIHLQSDWHRYFPLFAHSQGYKIKEIPTKCYPRGHGKSNFGFGRILIGFLDLLVVKFYLSYMKSPMLFFGSLGVIFIGLGCLLGGCLLFYLIATAFQFRLALGYYVVLILLILMGIQFFSFGFLAEYLVSIRNDIKKNETI